MQHLLLNLIGNWQDTNHRNFEQEDYLASQFLAINMLCSRHTVQSLHRAVTSPCSRLTVQSLHRAVISPCSHFTVQSSHCAVTSPCSGRSFLLMTLSKPNYISNWVRYSNYIVINSLLLKSWNLLVGSLVGESIRFIIRLSQICEDCWRWSVM